MKKHFIYAAMLLAVLVPRSCVAQACPNIPLPAVAAASGEAAEKVCHTAYISLFDPQWKLPRLVAYELTDAHTLGCIPRTSGFHAEGDSAKPRVYSASGYDLGHMDPAQDNAWRTDVSRDSFSMMNVAPQLPGLNRQEWERLEEDVRAWALDRGDLLVYVGPVFSKPPQFLSGVAIPGAFFKIVVDRKTGEALAFEMPQKTIPKGDVAKWVVSVKDIETATGIQFHLKASAAAPWPADLGAWHKAHKKACSK